MACPCRDQPPPRAPRSARRGGAGRPWSAEHTQFDARRMTFSHARPTTALRTIAREGGRMTVLNINPLAVIVATIVPMVLGFLWYGPLFGNTWMAARGVTREQMGDVNAGQAYGLTTVLALVTAIAMAMVLSAASAQ